jgi:hypothetical protein
MGRVSLLHRVHRVEEDEEEPPELVAPAKGPHPRVAPLGEDRHVVAHHEDGAGHPVGDHHAHEGEREAHEGGDPGEGGEQLAIASVDQAAQLLVERHELDRLHVGLVEPEPEDDREQDARAGERQGILELEPSVHEVASPPVSGGGCARCGGGLGHAMLPFRRPILSRAPRPATAGRE